jgi:hypothetical protein
MKIMQGNIILVNWIVSDRASPENPGAINVTNKGVAMMPRIHSKDMPQKVRLITELAIREASFFPDSTRVFVKTGIKAVANAPPIITKTRLGKVKAMI